MRRLTPLLLLALAGCGSQAVLVEPGTAVRLSRDASGYVYVRDGNGQWIEGTKPVKLPAGWYVIPPPTTRPAN
jgi:hypothetical protein